MSKSEYCPDPLCAEYGALMQIHTENHPTCTGKPIHPNPRVVADILLREIKENTEQLTAIIDQGLLK